MHPTIKQYISQIGRKGGRAKSQAKTLAARRNGRKGGWPKGRKRKIMRLEASESSEMRNVPAELGVAGEPHPQIESEGLISERGPSGLILPKQARW